MQFGPIKRPAGSPHFLDQARFTGASIPIAFAEAGADDADRADVLADAIIDCGQDLVRRNNDHREIDDTGDVGDTPIGGQAPDLGGGWVDRHNCAGESGEEKIVEDR